MEEQNGYVPPASLNLNDFQHAIDDAMVQAIIKIGIKVNREELLKALKYDRGQYKTGYDAGFADGFLETLHIVRCRDCTNYDTKRQFCKYYGVGMQVNDFCSRGNER